MRSWGEDENCGIVEVEVEEGGGKGEVEEGGGKGEAHYAKVFW